MVTAACVGDVLLLCGNYENSALFLIVQSVYILEKFLMYTVTSDKADQHACVNMMYIFIHFIYTNNCVTLNFIV